MTELKELMKSLPAYADKFLTIICNVLRSYREICQSVYRGIVQPDSEDKKIWSASWLKDDDMSRFLKFVYIDVIVEGDERVVEIVFVDLDLFQIGWNFKRTNRLTDVVKI